ncbi:MAG: hypothetical protein QXH42_02940 [Thermoplasmata archaeon]
MAPGKPVVRIQLWGRLLMLAVPFVEFVTSDETLKLLNSRSSSG